MLGVSVDDKPSKVGSIGGRRLSTPPSSWRAQASPTRPEQPSLASVGSGMAAVAAFAHPRAAGAWVRPIFRCADGNVNVPYTLTTSLLSVLCTYDIYMWLPCTSWCTRPHLAACHLTRRVTSAAWAVPPR